MDDESIKKVVQEKMKDMEIVSNNRKKISIDDLGSTVRRSTLDLPEVKKKYTAENGRGADDTLQASTTAVSSGDIKVKLVQAKDRAQDSSAPANTRTSIFDNEGLLGSQG